jgi:hypothetical protein
MVIWFRPEWKLKPKTIYCPKNQIKETYMTNKLTVVVYRTDIGGMRVGLFKKPEQAEAQAIAWVKKDYNPPEPFGMDELRDLESEEMFAVDIYDLTPGETATERDD